MARSATMPARDRKAFPVAEEKMQVRAHFHATAAYWKQVYEGHDLSATIYQDRRDAVLELVDKLNLPAESQVLEVGCGAGVTTVALAQRGYTVEAVDSAPAMIDLAREAARIAGVSSLVNPSVRDGNSLAFAERTFDLVVAIGVVPWVESVEQALREMIRVLRPGGYLLVSSENQWQLHHVLDPILNPLVAGLRPKIGDALRRLGLRKPLAAPRHQACSNREFDRQLARLNMKKLEARTVGFGPFSLGFHEILSESLGVKTHRALQQLADRKFPVLRSAGSNYIVLARASVNG